MRQLRFNSALLAFALAPLVFDLCASLVTGGSFANALSSGNLWFFPFLIASGTILFINNFREVKKRHDREIANRPFNGLRTAMPDVEKKIKVIARRALPSGSASTFAAGTSQDADRHDPPPQPPPEATPETLEGLVAEIWAGPDGDIKPPAYRAAWRLAALMTSTNARAGIRR